MSLTRTQYASYIATGFATVALVLFVGNAWLVNSTQAMQRQLNERQAEINNGVQVSQLNSQLVRALGAAVVSQKDEKIKGLLTAQGITVELEKPAAGAAPAKPAAKKPATPEAAAPAAAAPAAE